MIRLPDEAVGLRLPAARPSRNARRPSPLKVKSTRPSLVDLRFTGDPWMREAEDGTCEVVLGATCLGRVCVEAIDLPTLRGTLERLRLPCRGRALQACCRADR